MSHCHSDNIVMCLLRTHAFQSTSPRFSIQTQQPTQAQHPVYNLYTHKLYTHNLYTHNPCILKSIPPAGTGKTALLRQHLSTTDPSDVCTCTLSLSSLTTAPTLQPLLEAPLEKKTGTQYGAPGMRRLVYFVDDLNMPAKDKYDTQVCL